MAYYIKQAAQQVIVPVITAPANTQGNKEEGGREGERERKREACSINNLANNNAAPTSVIFS